MRYNSKRQFEDAYRAMQKRSLKAKKPMPDKAYGLKKQDRRIRSELYIRGFGYLKQDWTGRPLEGDNITWRIGAEVGVNSNVIALKMTRPDRANMPFEHLTYKRLGLIIPGLD